MHMLVNQRTQSALDAFVARPVGALIVAGSRFSGTEAVIKQILNGVLDATNRQSILTVSRGSDGTIGVEKIRELKQWLTTRFSNRNQVARAVIITQSELMTHEAQNALLKVLEEPLTDTVIILETSERVRLLDTIRSRCQILKVLPLSSHAALEAATKRGVEKDKATTAYALSGGDPLLFDQLISGEASELAEHVVRAKEFLKLKPFDRLRMQPDYTQVPALSELVMALSRVCEAAMVQPASRIDRWAELLRVVKRAEVLLERNTAPKLVYTYVSVNL